MTDQAQTTHVPGERLVTQFTPQQRGWMVMALIAFLGIVYVGPAYTAAERSARRRAADLKTSAADLKTRAAGLRTRTTRRIRRLGGGPIRLARWR